MVVGVVIVTPHGPHIKDVFFIYVHALCSFPTLELKGPNDVDLYPFPVHRISLIWERF